MIISGMLKGVVVPWELKGYKSPEDPYTNVALNLHFPPLLPLLPLPPLVSLPPQYFCIEPNFQLDKSFNISHYMCCHM